MGEIRKQIREGLKDGADVLFRSKQREGPNYAVVCFETRRPGTVSRLDARPWRFKVESIDSIGTNLDVPGRNRVIVDQMLLNRFAVHDDTMSKFVGKAQQ